MITACSYIGWQSKEEKRYSDAKEICSTLGLLQNQFSNQIIEPKEGYKEGINFLKAWLSCVSSERTWGYALSGR